MKVVLLRSHEADTSGGRLCPEDIHRPNDGRRSVWQRWMLKMMGCRHLFVMVAFLSWVASLWLGFDPRFSKWWIFVDLGWIFGAIVFARLALIRRKWKVFPIFSLLLVATIVSDIALFAYRANNICGPRDHILQSEVNAIEVAKEWVSKRRSYGWQGISGVDVRDAMNPTGDCCEATRSRNWSDVIVWRLSMYADRGADRIFVTMQLSN
jgi:hypothetical protein